MGDGGLESHRHATSVWEWACAAAGLVLILAIGANLAYQAVTETSDIPVISLEPIEIVQTGENFVVRVEARNASNTTVAQLIIEGYIQNNGDVIETSRAVLDYLPGSSKRRIGIIFQMDPRSLDLQVHPKGYQEP